jgi:hypothetical protein
MSVHVLPHECCAQLVQYAEHFLGACSAVRLAPYQLIGCGSLHRRIAALMSKPQSAGRLLQFTDAFIWGSHEPGTAYP